MYSRVYVEITNICNMNCSFCHGHNRSPRRMTEDEFAHILDELKAHTDYIYYHLMGEPLTHPLLSRFLTMAAERGFRSVITTNGTLLSDRGQAILDAGVHKVSISLHSFENGGEELFGRYLDEVADFADHASSQGTIVALRLWNRGCDGGRNETILHDLRRRFEGDWKENWKGIRIRDHLHLEWGERFVWPDQNAPLVGKKEAFCYGMLDHFGILVDGTVVPCCLDSEGAINLGNVFDTPVSSILKSPRALAMAEGFRCRRATEDLCRRCGYAQRFVP